MLAFWILTLEVGWLNFDSLRIEASELILLSMVFELRTEELACAAIIKELVASIEDGLHGCFVMEFMLVLTL